MFLPHPGFLMKADWDVVVFLVPLRYWILCASLLVCFPLLVGIPPAFLQMVYPVLSIPLKNCIFYIYESQKHLASHVLMSSWPRLLPKSICSLKKSMPLFSCVIQRPASGQGREGIQELLNDRKANMNQKRTLYCCLRPLCLMTDSLMEMTEQMSCFDRECLSVAFSSSSETVLGAVVLCLRLS